ncbi:MAG: hypothetical protein QM763_17805 [Agriterribacter sp.]
MKNIFFRNITPVYVVCLIFVGCLLIQFFTTGNDYNIIAYLIIFIIFLAIAFAIDRLLASRVAYVRLIIFEIIFLSGCSLWYMYSSGYTEINIETSKPYFFVIYKENGLQKKDIPTTGLFKKSITITSNSNIYVDDALEYEAQVNPPKSWNYSFSSNKADTVINTKKITVQIFARQMSEGEQKRALQNEVKKLIE